jgi:tRNA U38,U39,U40 pseudouridine synthase TruA
MVVGYNGTDFSGSQKNPGVRTVEGVVEDALY